jgi:SSS family transporter
VHRLTTPDWIMLGLYVAMLAIIATYQKRKLHKQDDLFLAGRSMSRWPVAISMYVAIFSTNTLLGVIGWVNRPDGSIWIGLQNIGIVLAVPIVIWLYPDIYFRLRITSVYEYLERRFNYPLRAAAGVLFMSARVMWLATVLYGGSLVISQMTGFPNGQRWAILAMAGLGTALALTGGMRAVIWMDVAQFCVLFGSVALMAALAIGRSGGTAAIFSTAASAHRFDAPAVLSLSDNLSIASGLCLGMVSMLSSAGSDQVLIQTYLTAKNVREARGSLWFNGLVLKPLSLIFPLLGVIIFGYFRGHPADAAFMRNPDDALPVFILQVLPAGARGLAIAGIMAAMLTTLQAGLSALSACVQVDYIRRWRTRPISDRGAVLLGRSLMTIWAVAIVAAAFYVLALGRNNSIIQILNMIMYPFSGVLLGVFLLGLLTRRSEGNGTLLGAVLGLLLTLGLSFGDFPISSFYYGAIAAASTFAAGYCASLAFPSPDGKKIEGLTHA